MLKLIVGVKGTGKTKHLIEMVNTASEESKGSVVCIEKGTKLTYDIKHTARLIDTDQYNIGDAQSLFGFIAGIAVGSTAGAACIGAAVWYFAVRRKKSSL